HNLEDLRRGIAECSVTSLFLHAHQHQLRVPAGDELHPGDFNAWVNGVVQDRETAERLSFAIQNRGGSPAELRAALLEVLDSVPGGRARGHVREGGGCGAGARGSWGEGAAAARARERTRGAEERGVLAEVGRGA